MKSIFYTILSIVFMRCSSTNSVENPSIPSSDTKSTEKPAGIHESEEDISESESEGDVSDEYEDNETAELKIKIDTFVDCYKGNAKPNAKPGSSLCIKKLVKDWKLYSKSAKIYADKIPEGIDLKKMILQRQPVNIAMGTGSYDHTEWKKLLNESGLGDADGNDSFYTQYYKDNQKLAPNIALYCKTPVLDDSDSKNPKTHDMGVLSVSGFGFDDNAQPDYKYFLEKDGKSFKNDKKEEFKQAMRGVFDKIVRCAEHEKYKNIYLDGFGCGAFGGGVKLDVIDIYNALFIEYAKKCTQKGIKLINAYTSSPKLFPGSYDKMNCFTREWETAHGKIEETLFINNWDPHSLPGNGNNADLSVDGGYGRNAPISIIGCAAINKGLLDRANYVEI